MVALVVWARLPASFPDHSQSWLLVHHFVVFSSRSASALSQTGLIKRGVFYNSIFTGQYLNTLLTSEGLLLAVTSWFYVKWSTYDATLTCSEFISIVLAPAPFFRCWYWTQVLCMLGKDSATLLQWSQLLWEELLSSLLPGLLSLLGRNLFGIGYWHISVSMTSIPGNTAII